MSTATPAVIGFDLSPESRPRAIANLLLMRQGGSGTLAGAKQTADGWHAKNYDAGAYDHAELYDKVGRILFADMIRAWRTDIRMMTDARSRMAIRCYAYNEATNPAALRTDDESRVMRKLARACRRELQGLKGWHECANGRLWC
jgi:hypothetical protein